VLSTEQAQQTVQTTEPDQVAHEEKESFVDWSTILEEPEFNVETLDSGSSSVPPHQEGSSSAPPLPEHDDASAKHAHLLALIDSYLQDKGKGIILSLGKPKTKILKVKCLT